MTVSHFEALEREVPALEARQAMAWAQAALYPHLSPNDARRTWQGWAAQAYTPPAPVRVSDAVRRGNLFTLNGVPVDFAGLQAGLQQALGPGGLAA